MNGGKKDAEKEEVGSEESTGKEVGESWGGGERGRRREHGG